jgi:hypothetical protein
MPTTKRRKRRNAPKITDGRLALPAHLQAPDRWGIVRYVKDMAFASFARAPANAQLKGIGTITEIHLDSENHLLQLHGHLTGSRDDIRLTIHDYRLEVLEDCALVTISSFAASPQWVAGLMNHHVRGKAIRIPISNDSSTKKVLQSALFRLIGSFV